jgi:hypothetical protein
VEPDQKVTDVCKYDLVDPAYVQGKLSEKCNGKTLCNINYVLDDFSFLKPESAESVKECRDQANSNIFIQVPCRITDEHIVNKRQVEGLLIACMGVFISLFFVTYFNI